MATALRRVKCLANHIGEQSESVNGNFQKCLPVIVGGMVLDIQAIPSDVNTVKKGTTAPGKVRFIHGGVARNVAETVALLGLKPFLISVVGKDAAGETLLSRWRELDLPTEGIQQVSGESTPVVSAIFDNKGEVCGAVADVSLVESRLNPDWIIQFADVIQTAQVVMIDGNLSPKTLDFLCDFCSERKVPVWFEPVSIAKSIRVVNSLHKISYISPNEGELVAITNAYIKKSLKESEINEKIDKISVRELRQKYIPQVLNSGVRNIILTAGPEGALLFLNSLVKGRKEWHFPAVKVNVKNLSGAGDSLVGGCISALSLGCDILASISWGIVLAKETVQSQNNVPLGISRSQVEDESNKVLAQVLSARPKELP